VWNKQENEINNRQYKELSQLIGKKTLFCYGPATMPDRIFEAKIIEVMDTAALYEINGELIWKPFVNGPSIYAILINGKYTPRWTRQSLIENVDQY
jgi:hypothetical protein